MHAEVHGFFDDDAAHDAATTIRAWSTRLPLHDFLRKGPDVCLSERLSEVDAAPEHGRASLARGGGGRRRGLLGPAADGSHDG